MRDYALLAFIVGALPFVFQRPFIGVLLWVWFTCQQPHQEAWGFASMFRLNLIIVIVTGIGLLNSKEWKWPPIDLTLGLLIALLAWMTFMTVISVYPSASWQIWDQVWRVLILAFVVASIADSKVRIHAIIWIMTLSIVYYGVKGGIFTIQTGGVFHVFGPEGTIIGDNNHLALALLMALPLLNYLWRQSQSPWIRHGLVAAMVLCFVSVAGSYSRGAYIAMVGLAIAAWWRSKNRLLYPFVVATVAIPVLNFMPQSFYDRIDTISSAETDGSFMGRVEAWNVAYLSAVEYFPFALGFNGAQQQETVLRYLPNATSAHAAHSIYFQVLGDNGFIGLGMYLTIIALLFYNCSKVIWTTRNLPEWFWARDLAGMIQLSMVAFCTGGAGLSMAYYDVIFLYIGVLTVLRRMTKSLEAPRWSPALGSPALADAPLR